MEIKNSWIKKGIIYNPVKVNDWMVSHAYIPTPILIEEEIIRIFIAIRDAKNIGRIGYVDVRASNPFDIISISQTPCLDVGMPGTFDDNGVTPISIVNDNGKLYLYYAGWQLSNKVRYFIFGGVAVSDDMGISFKRVQKVPILERTDQEFLVRTAPCVTKNGNEWIMLYSGGSKTIKIDDKLLPSYSLRYLTSLNGTDWRGESEEVLSPNSSQEFGFGRPFHVYDNGIYKMWYSIRRFDKTYVIGYAESLDLKKWVRLDDELQSFTNNLEKYENEMQAFASVIKTKYGNYMFYNGNNFGGTGICYAAQNIS